MRVLYSLALTLLLSIHSAIACQICLPYPEDSLLDRINAAQDLVLAREDPETPFSLSSIQILRSSAQPPKLDLFLPSSTRRMLKVYPDRSILCGRSVDGWQMLAVHTPEVKAVLQSLLVNTWEEDRTKRAQFFVKYLNSDEPTLQRMAHLEVARAPYAVIRELGPVLDFEKVRLFLAKPRMLEWHGLYILLLAQSGDADDVARIKKRYQQCELYHSSLQVAAWTLAYLETDEEAFQQIKRDYFENIDHEQKEVTAVLDALSAYGSTHPNQWGEIAELYQIAIDRFPKELATRIDDLAEWEQWQAAETVHRVLGDQQQEMSIEHISKVRAFLSDASKSQQISTANEAKNMSGFPLWLCAIPLALIAGLTYSKIQKRA